MRGKLLGAIVIVLTIWTSAQARVGETEDQIALRYSTAGFRPLESRDPLGNEQRGYKFREFIVVVSFENGACVCETFFKQQAAEGGKEIKPNEIEAILGANAAPGVT